MAQILSKILNQVELANSDYRKKFVETSTSPNDFVTGDASLILSTTPFLPPGDSFVDLPMYPIGLTQQFSANEGIMGQFVPEIGSARKINTAGTASGSGSISRLEIHGTSLAAALFRPTFYFFSTIPELSGTFGNKLFASSSDAEWIKSLCTNGTDLYSADLSSAMDKVIAGGGMNGLLYKLPFGLLEVKRDARQRVCKINYYEQCAIRGQSDGMSAGQFQLQDNFSFEFERKRPLTTAGIFTLSTAQSDGVVSSTYDSDK